MAGQLSQRQNDMPRPRGFEEWGPKAQAYWDKKMPQNSKKHWLEEEDLDSLRKTQEVWVRRNFIRPAPPGFRPEQVSRKVKLTLVSEKTMVRKGETFRYHLKMQNIGQQPIHFHEPNSDFLLGQHMSSKYNFFVTPLGGRERKMLEALVLGPPGGYQKEIPEGAVMTASERTAWVRRKIAEERVKTELDATLIPGETLVSRKWGGLAGSFNELSTDFKFDKPGIYEIRAVYDDRPPLPPGEEIRRMAAKHASSPSKNERVDQELEMLQKEIASTQNGIAADYRNHPEEELKRYNRIASKALGLVESNVVTLRVVP